MKTLAASQDCRAILDRVGTLEKADHAVWGRMTAHQMVCHLFDSYSSGLGERTVSSASGPLQRTLVKWIALRAPMRWPHGVPTRPEVEQGVGGTPPGDFQSDRARLESVLQRFAASSTLASVPHPFFGRLSNAEWLRWGYLHGDHHLRQFGR